MISNAKIIIADDMEPILHYLEKVLSDVPEFEIVGKAKDGKELVDLVTKFKPELVITDVEMPECSGIEAVEKISKLGIKTKYILVTGSCSCIITCKARKMGILQVIKKPILDDKKFIDQIKKALIVESKIQGKEETIEASRLRSTQIKKKV